MEKQSTIVTGDSGGVFVGTFVHKLDPKKRLTIPSDWREVAGAKAEFILMPGINEKCLVAFPPHEISRRTEALRKASIADEQPRQMARMLASRSSRAPWDAQGRILISDVLMEYAGLKSDVVLVGAFETFELWSPEKWKQQQELSARLSLGEAARSVGF